MRHRNNAGANGIAQTIHRMVDAMQPVPTQPRADDCLAVNQLLT